jgi:hypothetical protein
VTSKRKQANDLARWEDTTRSWATAAGRGLALDLYSARETTARPFHVGVVLDPNERVLVETPLSFSADRPVDPGAPSAPYIRPWLVTNHRIVARLGDERPHGWRWEHMVGCRIDLTPGRETVALDLDGQHPLVWTGPGAAPLAVAAVFYLHGPRAMIEHPGLVLIRRPSHPSVQSLLTRSSSSEEVTVSGGEDRPPRHGPHLRSCSE